MDVHGQTIKYFHSVENEAHYNQQFSDLYYNMISEIVWFY